MSVAVVNPLGGALRHYTDALVSTVDVVARFDVDEPSVSGSSRIAWLLRYAGAMRAAARAVGRGGTIIVTWPVIGYLDLIVARVVPRSVRVMLVVHDPEPLVHAVGLDRRAQRLARAFGRRTTIVVHGSEALAAVTRQGFGPHTLVLPHPVLPAPVSVDPEALLAAARSAGGPRVAGVAPVADACGPAGPAPRLQTGRSNRPVVRVLGQWKPDRDIDLLAALAPRLGDEYSLEVIGRGWPSVPGWHVRDEFVPEAELDALLAGADAVLIPYRRFFQSGLAVRALEVGTPFVGSHVESLAGLLGGADTTLVSRGGTLDAWVRAITVAAGADRRVLRGRAVAAADHASVAWGVELAPRSRR